MNRTQTIEALKESPKLDVLIVGAGVNGIATFRDLALNDAKVLLVDRADFSSGASAASSHMAHGGIRYLENGEFRLVREAVQERNRMLQNAPHIVKPLPTTIPIFKTFSGLLNAPLKFFNILDRPAERGALVIKIGLMLYDAFTRKQKNGPQTPSYIGQKILGAVESPQSRSTLYSNLLRWRNNRTRTTRSRNAPRRRNRTRKCTRS